MSDENPIINEADMAVIKLVHEFNAAVQFKLAEIKQQAQQLTAQGAENAKAMSDADLDAELTSKLSAMNAPLTKAQAEEALGNVGRPDKEGFLLQSDISNQINSMSDEEIDQKLIDALAAGGELSEEQAKEQLEGMGPMKMLLVAQLLPQALTPSQDYTAMSDADLDAAAVKELMAQNPGVPETEVAAQVGQMPRGDKEQTLAQIFAQEAMGEVEHPAQAIAAEKGINIEELQAEMNAVVNKYGPEIVQQEMQKLSGPTMH